MGLLDNFSEFIKTPEGQGLLSAAFGGMATANRGQPINSLGKAGLAGVVGYGNALDRQERVAENALQNQYRQMQMGELRRKQEQQAKLEGLIKTLPPEQQQALGLGVGYDKIWERQNPKRDVKAIGAGVFDVSQFGPDGMPKKLGDVPQATPFEYVQNPDGTVGMKPGVLEAKRQIAAAGRPVVETKVFNNTKDDFKNERDLRNDFSGLPTTKAFNEVRTAYDQIQVAVKKESPAGDLAAATKIMKILDPGSVVRESELGMAMAATGAMDRLTNYADMVVKGTKLTPTQRKDFSDLATQLYDAAAGRYNSSAEEYRSVAGEYGLNADRVAKPAKRSSISNGGWSATVVK